MKKKLLALLLVVVTVTSMFTGCSKSLSLKEVQADPAAYIEAGLDKTLSSSPIGKLLDIESKEAISFDLKLSPDDSDEYIKLNGGIGHKELAILLHADAYIEDENFKGSMFLDKENIAIKADDLNDIFGTDSVGIGLKDFNTRFKNSAIYSILNDMISSMAGTDGTISDAISELGIDKIDFEKITKSYNTLLDEIQKLQKECTLYEITEGKTTIDGKKINTFQITTKISDDFSSKFSKLAINFYKDVIDAIPTALIEMDEDEIEDLLDEVKDSLSSLVFKSEITYTLAKKGGAVLEIQEHFNQKFTSELFDEDMTQSSDSKITFGNDPENVFAPQIEFTHVLNDKTKVTFIGESTIDKKEQALVFDATITTKIFENEKWTSDGDPIKLGLTINKDGEYNCSYKSEYDKYSASGTFEIDGAKIKFTSKIKDEFDDVINVKLDVNLDAEKPAKFEYEDILSWNEDKWKTILESFAGEDE